VEGRYVATLQRQAGWRRARDRIAVAFHPSFVRYLDRLGACRVVYYADDSFAKMPGWTEDSRTSEHALLDRADLIVAITEGVARSLPDAGRGRTRILPNGADAEAFIRGADDPCPTDLATIPRPRIGHVGSINPKIDLRLIDTLAERRTDWHWVLIGHVMSAVIETDAASRDAWHRLKLRPNVHVLGPRPYRALPAYETNMDVNAMLYRTDPGGWWEDVSPLKLHEYLAVGRPIVATDIAALEPARSLLSVARTPEDWIAAVERALGERDEALVSARRDMARANDWSKVAERFESWLMPLLATSPSSPG
jgi:glycosyltransferase involved in cell wall biosynthesis